MPKQLKKRKIKKIMKDLKKGIKPKDVAEKRGVAISTVYKYKKRVE